MYYIYQFEDLRTDEIVYVGLTDNFERRVKEHLRKDGLLYPLSLELEKEGLELLPSVIDSHSNLEEIRKLEKRHIQEKKPLLNTMHNLSAIDDRNEAKMLSNQIGKLMNERGFTYEESLLFINHFCGCEGHYEEYAAIRAGARIARNNLGLELPTEVEVLDIALEYYGVKRS